MKNNVRKLQNVGNVLQKRKGALREEQDEEEPHHLVGYCDETRQDRWRDDLKTVHRKGMIDLAKRDFMRRPSQWPVAVMFGIMLGIISTVLFL